LRIAFDFRQRFGAFARAGTPLVAVKHNRFPCVGMMENGPRRALASRQTIS
jgi:hypothetical protein